MATQKCALCRESPRGKHYGDNRFCKKCTITARMFLLQQRRHGVLTNHDIEILFSILDTVLVYRERLYAECFAKVRHPSELKHMPEAPSDDGELFDAPSDHFFMEHDDYFSSQREAREAARERFSMQMQKMIRKERERLATGGRRRTRLALFPFKEYAWRTPEDVEHPAATLTPENGNDGEPVVEDMNPEPKLELPPLPTPEPVPSPTPYAVSDPQEPPGMSGPEEMPLFWGWHSFRDTSTAQPQESRGAGNGEPAPMPDPPLPAADDCPQDKEG